MLNLKVRPKTGSEGPEVGYKYSSTLSLTLALGGVGGQCREPVAINTGKRDPDTHCTGGWVGPRTCVDKCGKSLTIQDIKLLPVVEAWAVTPPPARF